MKQSVLKAGFLSALLLLGLAPGLGKLFTARAAAAEEFSVAGDDADSSGGYLYIQSNHISEGQNSIIGYQRRPNGALELLPGSPFLTGGTGINNNTHGKLGPHDNDTPITSSASASTKQLRIPARQETFFTSSRLTSPACLSLSVRGTWAGTESTKIHARRES